MPKTQTAISPSPIADCSLDSIPNRGNPFTAPKGRKCALKRCSKQVYFRSHEISNFYHQISLNPSLRKSGIVANKSVFVSVMLQMSGKVIHLIKVEQAWSNVFDLQA
ncbi:hypothetical protein ACOMCU_00710 [Lysinibacillus sp. UGB7]|uniref:hypothetical protein n=1 Tax=Lysinibacillus sp. UGB7 TaxID=3411039 RepID=UPI003B762385